MQKAKFKIKGMHCNSCAALIEEKLKNHEGIIKGKVNYDSQKAVVIYEEQKIKELEIYRIIEESGDYKIEKIEEIKENSKSYQVGKYTPRITEEKRLKFPSGARFWLGFLAGFSAVSLIGNIILIGILIGLIGPFIKLGNADQSGSGIVQDTNLKPQNNPSAGSPSPTENQPTVQTFKITKDDHIRGDFNAPITLVEFSDFECPFCERHYPTLNKILSDYKGKVRLVYKHFPLSFHPNGQKAAEASECADEQGKFWEYHDKLFENQPDGYSLEKFKQWAKDLGLNSGKFNDCLDSGKFAQKVQADFQEGSQKGVNGTPATFVNGKLVSGALPYESFKQAIDGLLNQ